MTCHAKLAKVCNDVREEAWASFAGPCTHTFPPDHIFWPASKNFVTLAPGLELKLVDPRREPRDLSVMKLCEEPGAFLASEQGATPACPASISGQAFGT